VLDAAVSASFTFAAWLQPTDVPPATTTANWAYTLYKGPNVRIHFDRDRRLSARIRTSDGDVELRSDPFPPGSWRHAAVAVDDVAQQLFVFVDGEPAAGSPLSFTGHILPAPLDERGNWPEYAGRHWLGATTPGYTGDTDSNMFEGWLDDARLYARALSEAEVHAAMEPVGAPLVTIAHVSTLRPYALAIARAGAVHYVDRSYVITALPPTLDDGVLVRTANDDKWIAADTHLTLVLGQWADVFVCYDARATHVPAWLADGTWSETALVVRTSDVAARVYVKRMPAGDLTLGGNHAGGDTLARSNYYVVVTPVPAVEPLRAIAETGAGGGLGPSRPSRR
jgi:hypothetical protein